MTGPVFQSPRLELRPVIPRDQFRRCALRERIVNEMHAPAFRRSRGGSIGQVWRELARPHLQRALLRDHCWHNLVGQRALRLDLRHPLCLRRSRRRPARVGERTSWSGDVAIVD